MQAEPWRLALIIIPSHYLLCNVGPFYARILHLYVTPSGDLVCDCCSGRLSIRSGQNYFGHIFEDAILFGII
jgi:hypothetical protein